MPLIVATYVCNAAQAAHALRSDQFLCFVSKHLCLSWKLNLFSCVQLWSYKNCTMKDLQMTKQTLCTICTTNYIWVCQICAKWQIKKYLSSIKQCRYNIVTYLCKFFCYRSKYEKWSKHVPGTKCQNHT